MSEYPPRLTQDRTPAEGVSERALKGACHFPYTYPQRAEYFLRRALLRSPVRGQGIFMDNPLAGGLPASVCMFHALPRDIIARGLP